RGLLPFVMRHLLPNTRLSCEGRAVLQSRTSSAPSGCEASLHQLRSVDVSARRTGPGVGGGSTRRTSRTEAAAIRPRAQVGAEESLAQDLFHGPALGQLVDQLVHVADLPHQRVLDLFDANAADDPGDLAGVGIERWGLAEERLEVLLLLD